MTTKITAFFQKFIALAVFGFLVLSTVPGYARQPDQVNPTVFTLPITRTDVIPIYFQYGSQLNDTDITVAIAKITVSTPSLQFVPTGLRDLYYGDPNRPDTDPNIPQSPVCSKDYTGPSYLIRPSLVSNNVVTYGLQSARDTTAASGGAVVDRLRAKATGCVKVELKIAPGAVAGPVSLVFDEDGGNNGAGSTSYQADLRPARQIINFILTGSLPPPASSVASVAPPVIVSSTPPPVVATQTPRSGGLETTLIIFGGLALVAIFYVAYNLQKRNLTKADLGNSPKKKK